MMRNLSRALVISATFGTLAIASPVVSPAVAHAQPKKPKTGAKDDAKLRAGIALFEDHEFKKAAAEFAKVRAATKDPKALLWLGRALQESGEKSAALLAYKQYLKETDPNGNKPDSLELMGTMQALMTEVALVTVTAPAGSTITLDDAEVGTAPLSGPLYVDPGAHTLVATKGTYRSTKTLNVEGDARLNAQLTVADPAPAASAPAPPPKEAEPKDTTEKAPAAATAPTKSESSFPLDARQTVGYGAAVVLAAGSIFFGIKAAGTASDFDAKKSELGVARSDLDSLQSDTQLQAGLSLGLGVAALGAAAITYFVFKKKSPITTTGEGVWAVGRF